MTSRILAALTLSVATSACVKNPAASTTVEKITEGDGFEDDLDAFNLTGNFRRIRFDTGSAALDTRDRRELDRAARLLLRNPSVRVVVVGHTDTSGDANTNLALGLARARAVELYLEGRGVPENAVMSTTAGESAPLIDPESTGELLRTWDLNRRVEFRVAWDPHDAVDGSEDNFPANVVDALSDNDS
jgi:outer membrane protein OmpA-like peptidoglycan-associated protein